MRTHGTISCYTHGCHCAACLGASRDKARERRERARRAAGASIHCLICDAVFTTAWGRNTHEGRLHP